MKKYLRTLYKTFTFSTLLVTLLSIIVKRRFSVDLAYTRITIGVILIALILALAIRVFKSEKGNATLNIILGYVLVIPSLFIVRSLFGTYLFRFSWTIYILLAIIGIIYGLALLVASKKYKTEVNELNRLLLEKTDSLENEEEVD